MVDVGGGHGRLLAEILRANLAPQGVPFDLPEVVAGAADVLSGLGVAERVDVADGSFFESVADGANCYIAKAIIHIRRAIRPDGKLLLFECVVTSPGQAHFSKLLDLEMIVHVGDASGPQRRTARCMSAQLRADARHTHCRTNLHHRRRAQQRGPRLNPRQRHATGCPPA